MHRTSSACAEKTQRSLSLGVWNRKGSFAYSKNAHWPCHILCPKVWRWPDRGSNPLPVAQEQPSLRYQSPAHCDLNPRLLVSDTTFSFLSGLWRVGSGRPGPDYGVNANRKPLSGAPCLGHWAELGLLTTLKCTSKTFTVCSSGFLMLDLGLRIQHHS